MRQRIFFLMRTYGLTVLLFLLAKVVFMLCNGSGHDVSVPDYFDVLRHGLSLDLSTALYFLILPLLVSIVSLWATKTKAGTKTIVWVLRGYFAIVAFAFALAFVADTSLYPFWGFKLDASCLQYLSQPEGITQSVSVGYLLLRFLLVVVLTVGIYLLYSFRLSSPPFKGREAALSTKRKTMFTCAHVLLLPVMVIGIRGGLSESTTNIGQVYYSQNQFLNHAAVNPVFSFLYSLSHQLGDLSQYHFMDDSECKRLTDNIFTTESILADTLLTTTRPNVVVILMESAGEEFADAMPRLQQLKEEGIYFSRCYANSWRTDRGTVCALSGFPSFPSVSVMKMPEKSRSLPSVARSLQRQGYSTYFLYGGDINFTNMRSYLIATGWERLVSMDDYSSADQHSAKWGVRDDITFNTLYNEIVNNASPSAHEGANLWGYLTLSSHEPWDVPVQKNNDAVLNAFTYVDTCLADFVERLKRTPAWDNLLIVVTADHGINYKSIDQSTPLLKNHIPMLWLGGAVKAPHTVDIICNQSDMAATLLGQLQLPHDDFAFSRDVLSSTYTYPTAVHNYYNAQWIIDSTGHALYDFDARRFIVSETADANRLLDVSKAILQLTTERLKADH
ncbi:MAG: LTA synthase family protein [Prevotella sp.]|nr:LTA synthase family protein [Prevotella sp.]